MKMKKCPHCAEEIQVDAIICRFCNRKTAKSNIILNMIGLGVVVWIVWAVNEQGYFDGFLNQYFGSSITTVADATCEDLQRRVVGIELESLTGPVTDRTITAVTVDAVRNLVEISRNDNRFVCMGELLTAGNYSMLTMTVSDWEGKLWIQYEAR